MRLEEQVVSLELAKRLKELGVKQESIFYWNCFTPPTGSLSPFEEIQDHKHHQATEHFSAFTVAELGEMLPDSFSITKDANHWWPKLVDGTRPKGAHDDCEADARAKMMIYLIENKLVTL